MQLTRLRVKNFKSIRDIEIRQIENALLLVGQNSVGKTCILDAVRALGGSYRICEVDFNEKKQKIEISASLAITEEDLKLLHEKRIVSQYKRYEIWKEEFLERLPSFQDGILTFTMTANDQGSVRFSDGFEKHNRYIQEVFPKLYYLDSQRNMGKMQETLLSFEEDELLGQMRADCCLFDGGKKCSHCFSCIGLLNQKTPAELNAFETEKLLEYKLYQMNLDDFSRKVNQTFQKNGGSAGEIRYQVRCNTGKLFEVEANLYQENRKREVPVGFLGKGMKSIYMLSLLEAYIEDEGRIPGIILMEDPEIFLHPRLQKISGDILYRLSRKSQVIFSTHSPNLLSPFHSRQIRQVSLDKEGYTVVRHRTNVSRILDDLGYSAADLLNVSFVFIVEGKQDKSRLPLLLEKYYSEITNREGRLQRIAIVTTNSCTNIKTYANLKYMNQIYLKDQFLMIRDGDGKDREALRSELCSYYARRNKEDIDRLPKVTRKNVLVLKYYSFENYFLDPEVMSKVGVIKSPEDFYRIFLTKWKEYLYRLPSGRKLAEVLGQDLSTEEEVKSHMEEIKIHLRGHNLFDIFYGPFKKREREILLAYIDQAPREVFADILDPIDQFVYFKNRRKQTRGRSQN